MFTVIKLGGCNGSGKTTLARAVIEISDAKPLTWKGIKRSPNCYRGVYSGYVVLVLGSYETTCGGMDTISDKLDRLKMLEWAKKNADIVFYEGLITGKTYGAMGAMSESDIVSKKGAWLYAFMDTPFEVCVQRVLGRRAAKGNLAPFDPERTMRPTYRGIESLRGRVVADRLHPVAVVDHEQAPKRAAAKLLRKAAILIKEGLPWK